MREEVRPEPGLLSSPPPRRTATTATTAARPRSEAAGGGKRGGGRSWRRRSSRRASNSVLSSGRPSGEAIMVGNQVAQNDTRSLTTTSPKRMRDAYPELETVRAASEDPVYLVGGAVRDLLLGRGRSANLDLVVEGDAAALADRLGPEVLEHERFGTATVRLGEPRGRRRRDAHRDLRAAGRPARGDAGAPIEADLGTPRLHAQRDGGRRSTGGGLIDPHGGRADLDSRAAARPPPASPSATTRPGRCAPPATRPGSDSGSSRRPRS